MIEMESKKWNEKIKNNFNDAAYRYLEHSNIQKFFAKKIVQFIKELNPQKKGEWIDLGSGPGPVSYTHLTLPTNRECRSRWSPYH